MNLSKSLALSIAAFLISAAASLYAQQRDVQGSFSGSIFTGGPGGFSIYDSTGKIVRTYKTKRSDEGCILANGNALIANSVCVAEYTPEMDVVFEYTPVEQKGGGTFSCQRLENGNTVVGENASGRIVEIDADGKEVFSLQTPHTPGSHNNMRYVRKLENGNYLACHKNGGLKEYAPDGTVVWEPVEKEAAYHAVRTPQGTTLATTLKAIKEYGEDGSTLWSCEVKEIEGLIFPEKKAFMTGLHLLANGNMIIGIYPKGGCFEITKDKELVWHLQSGASGLAVQKLDDNYMPLTDGSLR